MKNPSWHPMLANLAQRHLAGNCKIMKSASEIQMYSSKICLIIQTSMDILIMLLTLILAVSPLVMCTSSATQVMMKIIFQKDLDGNIQCRCNDRRCNVLQYHFGCRQNHSLSGNQKCWVPPSVPLSLECPQHCLMCSLKCNSANWISCHSQEYIDTLTWLDCTS